MFAREPEVSSPSCHQGGFGTWCSWVISSLLTSNNCLYVLSSCYRMRQIIDAGCSRTSITIFWADFPINLTACTSFFIVLLIKYISKQSSSIIPFHELGGWGRAWLKDFSRKPGTESRRESRSWFIQGQLTNNNSKCKTHIVYDDNDWKHHLQ